MKQEKLPKSSCISSSYDKLKRMVDSETVDIKLIISPPRTGSTLMESSFSESPSIDICIHEPFIALRKRMVNKAYDTILKEIVALKQSSHKKTVVIKEMSHWLCINDEYKRFLTLVRGPVIILIRNPLLNTESRIKKILETLDLREKQEVIETLLDFYAQTKGEKNWIYYLSKYDDISECFIKDEAVKIYRKLEKLDGLLQIESFPFQRWLLDYYAIMKGFKRWKIMLQEGCDNLDYRLFQEILQDERIYGVDETGWKSIIKIVDYLENIGKEMLIVDSTDYRLDCEAIVPLLCKKMDIQFSETMIAWGGKELGLYTNQIQPHQSIWYDRLQSSTHIEPPTEIIPSLQDFPDFIVKHLIDIDFPAYIRLIKSSSIIRAREQSMYNKIQVPVMKKIYKRLMYSGSLSESVNLINKKNQDKEIFEMLFKKNMLSCDIEKTSSSLLEEAYLEGRATVGLDMFEIDPVFVYLSNEILYKENKFIQENKIHNFTINVIKEILKNKNYL